MAIIREQEIDGKVGNFWYISEQSFDTSLQILSYRASLFSSVIAFLDNRPPVYQTWKTYKGVEFYLTGSESPSEFKRKCYEKLKEELNGGYDYPVTGEDWCPKIYKYLKSGINIKHFHSIDYTIELTINLHRIETFAEKGLLTKVEYFTDDTLTDKILEFNRTYQHNPVDGIISKHTTRTYFNVDETPNSDVKDLGSYKYTENQGRKATLRRRENIIFNIEKNVIDMIKVDSPPEDLYSNMTLASEFVSQISTMKNSFISSGNPTSLIAEINKQTVKDQYPFLLWGILSYTNVIEFMTDQLIY